MIQIFIFGSSSAYGVGSKQGGWADILKRKLHEKMYGENGLGEKYELFNFSKAGSPINFFQKTLDDILQRYKRDDKSIALVSLGGNNSKAEGEPDNFVSTIDEYKKELEKFLSDVSKNVNHTLFIGGGFVDETKTNPKPNPLTGGKSYFSNERRTLFSKATEKICKNLNIIYINTDTTIDEWIENYIYKDGLHANSAGHELIFNKIWEQIKPLLE